MQLLRVAKAGYCSLREARELTAREVVQALHHESFLGEYEVTYVELNKQ